MNSKPSQNKKKKKVDNKAAKRKAQRRKSREEAKKDLKERAKLKRNRNCVMSANKRAANKYGAYQLMRNDCLIAIANAAAKHGKDCPEGSFIYRRRENIWGFSHDIILDCQCCGQSFSFANDRLIEIDQKYFWNEKKNKFGDFSKQQLDSGFNKVPETMVRHAISNHLGCFENAQFHR